MGKIRPFKIVGEVIGCFEDDDGNIVGEFKAGSAVIYASQFGEVDQIVGAAWRQADAAGRLPDPALADSVAPAEGPEPDEA